MNKILINLRNTAAEQFAPYKQYNGYFADWMLARVTKRITMKKSGMTANKNSYVLVKPGSEKTVNSKDFVTVWHDGWMCAASVETRDIEIICNG